jgi:hypothetical protein
LANSYDEWASAEPAPAAEPVAPTPEPQPEPSTPPGNDYDSWAAQPAPQPTQPQRDERAAAFGYSDGPVALEAPAEPAGDNPYDAWASADTPLLPAEPAPNTGVFTAYDDQGSDPANDPVDVGDYGSGQSIYRAQDMGYSTGLTDDQLDYANAPRQALPEYDDPNAADTETGPSYWRAKDLGYAPTPAAPDVEAPRGLLLQNTSRLDLHAEAWTTEEARLKAGGEPLSFDELRDLGWSPSRYGEVVGALQAGPPADWQAPDRMALAEDMWQRGWSLDAAKQGTGGPLSPLLAAFNLVAGSDQRMAQQTAYELNRAKLLGEVLATDPAMDPTSKALYMAARLAGPQAASSAAEQLFRQRRGDTVWNAIDQRVTAEARRRNFSDALNLPDPDRPDAFQGGPLNGQWWADVGGASANLVGNIVSSPSTYYTALAGGVPKIVLAIAPKTIPLLSRALPFAPRAVNVATDMGVSEAVTLGIGKPLTWAMGKLADPKSAVVTGTAARASIGYLGGVLYAGVAGAHNPLIAQGGVLNVPYKAAEEHLGPAAAGLVGIAGAGVLGALAFAGLPIGISGATGGVLRTGAALSGRALPSVYGYDPAGNPLSRTLRGSDLFDLTQGSKHTRSLIGVTAALADARALTGDRVESFTGLVGEWLATKGDDLAANPAEHAARIGKAVSLGDLGLTTAVTPDFLQANAQAHGILRRAFADLGGKDPSTSTAADIRAFVDRLTSSGRDMADIVNTLGDAANLRIARDMGRGLPGMFDPISRMMAVRAHLLADPSLEATIRGSTTPRPRRAPATTSTVDAVMTGRPNAEINNPYDRTSYPSKLKPETATKWLTKLAKDAKERGVTAAQFPELLDPDFYKVNENAWARLAETNKALFSPLWLTARPAYHAYNTISNALVFAQSGGKFGAMRDVTLRKMWTAAGLGDDAAYDLHTPQYVRDVLPGELTTGRPDSVHSFTDAAALRSPAFKKVAGATQTATGYLAGGGALVPKLLPFTREGFWRNALYRQQAVKAATRWDDTMSRTLGLIPATLKRAMTNTVPHWSDALAIEGLAPELDFVVREELQKYATPAEAAANIDGWVADRLADQVKTLRDSVDLHMAERLGLDRPVRDLGRLVADALDQAERMVENRPPVMTRADYHAEIDRHAPDPDFAVVTKDNADVLAAYKQQAVLKDTGRFISIDEAYAAMYAGVKFGDSEWLVTPRDGLFQIPPQLREQDVDLAQFGTDKERAAGSVAAKVNRPDIDKAFDKIDRIRSQVPNPLLSPGAWSEFYARLVNTADPLLPPVRAIEYAADPALIKTRVLDQMRPQQLDEALRGLREVAKPLGERWHTGQARPSDTLLLFLWGIASRRLSAFPQESAFIDAVNRGVPARLEALLAAPKDEDGLPSAQARVEFEAWVKTALPPGSPSRPSTANLNDWVKLIYKLTKPLDEDTATRVGAPTALDHIHRAWSDPSLSGGQLRREFWRVNDSIGVDNKVLSFMALVTGRQDVLVLDRIQFRHLWGADDPQAQALYMREFSGWRTPEFDDGIPNIYEGFRRLTEDEDGTVKEYAEGIGESGEKLRGTALYEALEDALGPAAAEAFRLKGLDVPAADALGTFHWLSWVQQSDQEVSHGSLEVLGRVIDGYKRATVGIPAIEGRYFETQYGWRYVDLGERTPQFIVPLPDGTHRLMTVPEGRKFQAQIKAKGIRKNAGAKALKDAKFNRPWYEHPNVDVGQYLDLAHKFGRASDAGGRPIDAGAGGPRPDPLVDPSAGGTGRLPGRDADGSGTLYQRPSDRPLFNGATQFTADTRALVVFTRTANVSTIIHEYGHVVRRHLDGEDAQVIGNAYGARHDQATGRWVYTVDQEEAFARDFERFWLDPKNAEKLPTATRAVFATMLNYVARLYRQVAAYIAQSWGRTALRADVEAVFTRIITAEPLAGPTAVDRGASLRPLTQDPGTPLFQRDPGDPWYYRSVDESLRTIEKVQAKGTAEQMRKMVLSKGVKAEEMVWSGLDEYLAAAQAEGRQVTARELRDHAAFNTPSVVDVTKGMNPTSLVGRYRRAYEDGWAVQESLWRVIGNVDDHYWAATNRGMDASRAEAATKALNEIWQTRPTPDVMADVVTMMQDTPNFVSMVDDHFRLQGDIERLGQELRAQGIDPTSDTFRWESAPDEPKHQTHVLPGGENYREVLLTLSRQDPGAATARDWRYTPHWAEANVLAHIRFNDRTDAQGRRVLFIEEAQSDWHQRGQKYGYEGVNYDEKLAGHQARFDALDGPTQERLDALRLSLNTLIGMRIDTMTRMNDEARASLDRRIRLLDDEIAQVTHTRWTGDTKRAAETLREAERYAPGLPDAPYKTSWPDLVLRRMLALAADEGYDAIAWTTGKQQSDRWGGMDGATGAFYDTKFANAAKAIGKKFGMTLDDITVEGLGNQPGLALSPDLKRQVEEKGLPLFQRALGEMSPEDRAAAADAFRDWLNTPLNVRNARTTPEPPPPNPLLNGQSGVEAAMAAAGLDQGTAYRASGAAPNDALRLVAELHPAMTAVEGALRDLAKAHADGNAADFVVAEANLVRALAQAEFIREKNRAILEASAAVTPAQREAALSAMGLAKTGTQRRVIDADDLETHLLADYDRTAAQVKAALSALPADVTPQAAANLTPRRVRELVADRQRYARAEGLQATRAAFFGYDDRTMLQYALDHVVPYTYWPIKHGLQQAQWFANHPVALGATVGGLRYWDDKTKDETAANRWTILVARTDDGEWRIRPGSFWPYATQQAVEFVPKHPAQSFVRERDVFGDVQAATGLSMRPLPYLDLPRQWAATQHPSLADVPGIGRLLPQDTPGRRATDLFSQSRFIRELTRGAVDLEGELRRFLYGTTALSNEDYRTIQRLFKAVQDEPNPVIATQKARELQLALADHNEGKASPQWDQARYDALAARLPQAVANWFGLPLAFVPESQRQINDLNKQYAANAKAGDKDANKALLKANPGLPVFWSRDDDPAAIRSNVQLSQKLEERAFVNDDIDRQLQDLRAAFARQEISGLDWSAKSRILEDQRDTRLAYTEAKYPLARPYNAGEVELKNWERLNPGKTLPQRLERGAEMGYSNVQTYWTELDEITTRFGRDKQRISDDWIGGSISGVNWSSQERYLDSQQSKEIDALKAKWKAAGYDVEGLSARTSSADKQPVVSAAQRQALDEYRAITVDDYRDAEGDIDWTGYQRKQAEFLAALPADDAVFVRAETVKNRTEADWWFASQVQPVLDKAAEIGKYKNSPDKATTDLWTAARSTYTTGRYSAEGIDGGHAAGLTALRAAGISETTWQTAQDSRNPAYSTYLNSPAAAPYRAYLTEPGEKLPVFTVPKPPTSRGIGGGSGGGRRQASGLLDAEGNPLSTDDFFALANALGEAGRKTEVGLLYALNADKLRAAGYTIKTTDTPRVAALKVERGKLFDAMPGKGPERDRWLASGNAKRLNEIAVAFGEKPTWKEQTLVQYEATERRSAIWAQYYALPGGERKAFLDANRAELDALAKVIGGSSTALSSTRAPASFSPAPRRGGGGGGGGGGGRPRALPPAALASEAQRFKAELGAENLALLTAYVEGKSGLTDALKALLLRLRLKYPFGVKHDVSLEQWLAAMMQAAFTA